MAGGVDQVQVVGLPVGGRVLDPHRLGLDRDPALALEVHRVEHLGLHFLRVDGAGELEDAVGQGRLAVVYVGDDREVADVVHRAAEYGEWLAVRGGRGVPLACWVFRQSRLRLSANVAGAKKRTPLRAADTPRPPHSMVAQMRHYRAGRWIQGAFQLEDDRWVACGGSAFDAGAFGPAGGRWVWGLARFYAVAGGDYVVVVAGVEEVAPLLAGGRGGEAAVGLLFAYVLDVVGEVGAEEGVLAGGGGGYAGARRSPLAHLKAALRPGVAKVGFA